VNNAISDQTNMVAIVLNIAGNKTQNEFHLFCFQIFRPGFIVIIFKSIGLTMFMKVVMVRWPLSRRVV